MEDNKKNTVVSLFSGGGGLDIGFQQAGYVIKWAIDNNADAVATYQSNVGHNIVYEDINSYDEKNIPYADIVIGGPPCQSFSLAGKRNVEDSRGRLVWKYIDIIKHIHPKAFLFENVVGLLSAKNKAGEYIFELLKDEFKKIGYTINAKVLNAADYGVPQLRKRIILVGIRGKKEFVFPNPLYNSTGIGLKKYVSVKDAIGDLPPVRLTNDNEVQNNEITDHIMPSMSELDKFIISYVKPGGNYMDIPSTVKSKRIKRLQAEGGHTTCYGRLHPDKPAYTINTYFNRPNVGCNIHYSENRLITVREALRLQTFPDSYKIIAHSKQGKNLIVGNAVPPLLAHVLAEELKKYL